MRSAPPANAAKSGPVAERTVRNVRPNTARAWLTAELAASRRPAVTGGPDGGGGTGEPVGGGGVGELDGGGGWGTPVGGGGGGGDAGVPTGGGGGGNELALSLSGSVMARSSFGSVQPVGWGRRKVTDVAVAEVSEQSFEVGGAVRPERHVFAGELLVKVR